MKGLIGAIQFITILPVGKSVPFEPNKMIPFFPIVGLVLGLMVAVFDQVVLRLWNPSVAAVLDVVLLVILTGAFHLDGLGDAADGLLGQRPKEKALAIMKDPSPAVFGGPHYGAYHAPQPRWWKEQYGSFEPAQASGALGPGDYLQGNNIVIQRELLAAIVPLLGALE